MTLHICERSPFVLDWKRTQREHVLRQREERNMWLKDAGAAVGFLVFVAASYLLVPVAQTMIGTI
jgi:hypothetical protein